MRLVQLINVSHVRLMVAAIAESLSIILIRCKIVKVFIGKVIDMISKGSGAIYGEKVDCRRERERYSE